MAFVRVKYRPKPIHPELDEEKAQENVAFSLAKKEKAIEEDPYSEIKKISAEETVFLSSHTQKKRVEVFIESDEAGYRRKNQPNIYQRIETQKEWIIEQIQEEKISARRDALIRKADKAMQQMSEASDLEGGSPDNTLMDYDDSLEQDLDLLEADDDNREDTMEDNPNLKQTQQQLKEQFLLIKERKVVMMRKTEVYHKGLTLYQQRKLFFKMFFGWNVNKNNSKNHTFILDWLILGRKEIATNLQALLKLNVTHVLNMTQDIKNSFSKHFMYEKIPVRDSDDEDIGKYFPKMIAFIKRCEMCKGRIFVHCLAGSSRAPTAVLAYLITEKRIPLLDAYNLVTILRPFVRPNNRFLYQLAMLEVQLGEGCSVYYHKDWRFYEFNLFRGEGVQERESIGLYRTILKLYHKDDVNLLDGESSVQS